MAWQLTASGTRRLARPRNIPFTHVHLVKFDKTLPSKGRRVEASILYQEGSLDGAGKFNPINEETYAVPEADLRVLLTATDVRNITNQEKEDEVVLTYLFNEGVIGAGIIVAIPE